MKQVVITADDFGIAAETNAAVEIAHRSGVLTSASVMTNMPAFEDAVAIARRNPRLGVGVHLSLTSGRPVSPPARVPLLVDSTGIFRCGYAVLSWLLMGPHQAAALQQIARELSAQVEKAIQAGLEIDHIDGHRHVHMIPGIWQIVLRLAAEQGVVVRAATERPGWNGATPDGARNLVKAAVLQVCAQANESSGQPIRFTGLMDSGCVNVRVLRRLLGAVPSGTTEIVTHPSLPLPPGNARLCCSDEDERFLRARGRRSELDALINPKVFQFLQEHEIRTVTFGTRETNMVADASRTASC